jgi:hypothetical protein
LDEAELKLVSMALDPNYEIELTAEEESKAKTAREANAKIQAEAAKMEKEKQDASKAESKVRRAKSYLESAKTLLDKSQRAAAKKYLEKAIAEDPDSDTGKAAKKLLDKLP